MMDTERTSVLLGGPRNGDVVSSRRHTILVAGESDRPQFEYGTYAWVEIWAHRYIVLAAWSWAGWDDDPIPFEEVADCLRAVWKLIMFLAGEYR